MCAAILAQDLGKPESHPPPTMRARDFFHKSATAAIPRIAQMLHWRAIASRPAFGVHD
jgi:hypothetical protein